MSSRECVHCGYEVGGLPEALTRCPECGEVIGSPRPGPAVPARWQNWLFAGGIVFALGFGVVVMSVELGRYAPALLVPGAAVVVAVMWYFAETRERRRLGGVVEIGCSAFALVMLSVLVGAVVLYLWGKV